MPGWLSGLGELILAQDMVHSLCTGPLRSSPQCPLPSVGVLTSKRSSGQALHFISRGKHHPLEWPCVLLSFPHPEEIPKVSPFKGKLLLPAHVFRPQLIGSIPLEPGLKEGKGRREPHGSLEAKRDTRSPLSLGEHVPNDLTSFPCSPPLQGPITSQQCYKLVIKPSTHLWRET